MNRLRLGIAATVAGASLLLGGGVGRANAPAAGMNTAGLTIGVSSTGSPLARLDGLLPNPTTVETQLRSFLQRRDGAARFIWLQLAISDSCVNGADSCIGPKGSILGDLTLAEVQQAGPTNTNGGAPLAAVTACIRVHVTAPDTGTLTETDNLTGPLLASGYAGAVGLGAVRLLNAAKTSTAAVATDGTFSTGYSQLQLPTDGTVNATSLITGRDVADNPDHALRSGALSLTLKGPVSTRPFTNGNTGTGTIAPGSMSCSLRGGGIEAGAINELYPAP
jgi:hypothetical protein